jgi:hypothetical protein
MKNVLMGAILTAIVALYAVHYSGAQSFTHYITYRDANRGSLDGVIDTLKWFSEQQGVNRRHRELLDLEREKLRTLSDAQMRTHSGSGFAQPPGREGVSESLERALLEENRSLRDQVDTLRRQVASLVRIIEVMAAEGQSVLRATQLEEVENADENDPLGLRR